MVADPAGFAHAAGREDHLRRLIKIDGLRLLAGDGHLQAREKEGIAPRIQNGPHLLVKIAVIRLHEDAGRFIRQRRVDIDREIRMAGHQPSLLDLPYEIQQLLGAPHREGRDHHIAAAVERRLDIARQLRDKVLVVRSLLVIAVPVRGLHHNIVCLGNGLRVLQDRLVRVAQIAGEHDLLRGLSLGQPQRNARRAEQMAGIRKAHVHALQYGEAFVILAGDKPRDGRLGILHGIHGLHLASAGALPLAVLPLRLHLLDVRRVPQHDIAEIAGSFRGVDLSFEAVFDQQRQQAGVVDMCVGQYHAGQLGGIHRNILVDKDISALLHAEVHQEIPVVYRQHTAGTGHFVCRAQKGKLHTVISLPSGISM